MEASRARGDQSTTVAVVARLVSRVSRGDAPLGVIADALTDLAHTIDATRVVVAVDDRHLGRQVFTSARAPLGTEPVGLFGATGTWTDPGGRLDDDEADLVTATVGTAVGALPHEVAPVPIAAAGAAVRAGSVESMLSGAVARARDHGWEFALALLRFDDGDTSPARVAALQSGLRPGDIPFATGTGTIMVMLPAVRDEQAATILAAAVRFAALPRCSFGLTQCPNDAVDAPVLVRIAASDGEATGARDPGTDRD